MTAVATIDQARALTQEIRDHLTVSWRLIAEAYETRVWDALGYSSWDDYLAAEFGAAPLRVPREQRAEVVGSLRQHGLSTRAIAGAMGVDHSTVVRTAPTGADAPDDRPARVHSLDGRSRPASQPPRPRPEPFAPTEDQVLDAIERRRPGSRAEVEHKRLGSRWATAVAGAADITLLDAEHVASAVDPTELSVGASTLRRALAVAEDALGRQQTPGLRVVGGNR